MSLPVLSSRDCQSQRIQEIMDSFGAHFAVAGSFEKAVRKVFAAFEGTRDNPRFGRAIRAEFINRQGNVLATPHEPIHK